MVYRTDGGPLIGTIIGFMLLTFGFIFVLVGSISWGVMDANRHYILFPTIAGTFRLPGKEISTNRFYKIFAIAATMVGIVFILSGIMTCSYAHCSDDQEEYPKIYSNILPAKIEDSSTLGCQHYIPQVRTINNYNYYPEFKDSNTLFKILKHTKVTKSFNEKDKDESTVNIMDNKTRRIQSANSQISISSRLTKKKNHTRTI